MTELEALELAADNAAAAGDFRTALRMLERAVNVDASGEALWFKLSAMRKASGDVPGALVAVDRALAIAPLNFSTLLHRAMLLDLLGDAAAGEEFGNALAQLSADSEVPPTMEHAVARARERWAAHQATLEEHLRQVLPLNLPVGEKEKAERFISNRSRRTKQYHQEPSSFHYPGMPEIEFYDTNLFPNLRLFEGATAVIQAEFNALIRAEAADVVPYIRYPERLPLRQWKQLNENPSWSAIHLLQNGRLVDQNARHCPRTMELLSKLPQPHVMNASPNAMFSLLAPRTHIPAHTGAANTRLVCHLPLIVPPNCRFRVGAITREWHVGNTLVFDDTIEHEAWNESDDLRVVLIFDLWAPGLSKSERQTVAAIMGAAAAPSST